ncbi:MAG: hypothetical protein IIY21_26165 [Clostridiales bacterium]|nr:hypothetical protein [Clostridiales bacterium]MBQ1573098.1 hypothetical protein [Clostridiales bacterium]
MIYRTVKDILTSKVTMLINHTGWLKGNYIQKDTPLWSVLNPKEFEARCDEVAAAPYHSQEQKDLKDAMPRFYIGGTFPKHSICNDKVIEYTNLVCIDVDRKDNPDMDLEEIRRTLFALDYVFAVYLSASRKGFYAIIPILDGRDAPAYCEYIRRLWKFKYNIVTDRVAENIARARIISYDKDWMQWTKTDDVRVWELKVTEETEERPKLKPEQPLVGIYKKQDVDMKARTHLAMQMLIGNGYTVSGYWKWLRAAKELKNFTDGFELWYTMTVNNSEYNDRDRKKLERKYNGLTTADLDDDTHRKWQGIAKRELGEGWWKQE